MGRVKQTQTPSNAEKPVKELTKKRKARRTRFARRDLGESEMRHLLKRQRAERGEVFGGCNVKGSYVGGLSALKSAFEHTVITRVNRNRLNELASVKNPTTTISTRHVLAAVAQVVRDAKLRREVISYARDSLDNYKDSLAADKPGSAAVTAQ